MNKLFKIALLAVFLLCGSNTSLLAQSQDSIVPFAPIGSEWWFSELEYSPTGRYSYKIEDKPKHFLADMDTLIKGKLCRRVRGNGGTIYFYPHKNGLDYLYKDSFWTFYNTTWKVGDTVIAHETYNKPRDWQEFDSIRAHRVEKIDTFSFAGKNLRRWTLKPIIGPDTVEGLHGSGFYTHLPVTVVEYIASDFWLGLVSEGELSFYRLIGMRCFSDSKATFHVPKSPITLRDEYAKPLDMLVTQL